MVNRPLGAAKLHTGTVWDLSVPVRGAACVVVNLPGERTTTPTASTFGPDEQDFALLVAHEPWMFSSLVRPLIRIITETGLRVYKELAPMKRTDVDLENAVVWIPDSKTASGVAEVPLTDLAVEAFRNQMARPVRASISSRTPTAPAFRPASRRSGARRFARQESPTSRTYDLRSTYATRLSAGGVAEEWVWHRRGGMKGFRHS
jgi:integrase